MDILNSLTALVNPIASSPGVVDFSRRYKKYYKEGSIWNLEAGSLLFSSWMVYYLIFVSPEKRGVLDIIVLIFYILGVLIFLATSSLFTKLNRTFQENQFVSGLKTANRYLFMVLSFLPGLYFAFKYEHFILRYYLVIHIVTSVYFLYKRYREFELEPFLMGLGMSAALFCIGPIIRGFFGIFGSGYFLTSCASTLESLVDLGIAVAFLLQLPQKHLPPNMLFGLKIVKYFMYFLSWQTWFILMIFATWSNLGAGAQAIMETYKAIDITENDNTKKGTNLPSTSKSTKFDTKQS